MQDIIDEVNKFLSTYIDPVQRRFLFQSRPSEAALKDTPLILMLGNHSSGKSSFINHFLNQDLQLTGMAPTDEDFTIIRYGTIEQSQSGNSLISNPELGYAGLSQFGPRFLSHLRLKSSTNERLKKISLVDTPGMIDSADQEANRGYEFQSVVRWFAERADLVMLFFDPERPGTTAETLHVYTHALRDFDHKLLVIMNKVDQFKKLSDFARCYGTLCWNLGKVMRTKDLPQIYVTYLPLPNQPRSPLPMEEFELSRQKLLDRMQQTTLQRADNVLTEVTIYLDRLLLHTQILDQSRSAYRQRILRSYGIAILFGIGSALLTIVPNPIIELSPPLTYAAIAFATLFSFMICYWFTQVVTSHAVYQAQNDPTAVFEQYATVYRVRNEQYETLKAHWQTISNQTLKALSDIGPAKLPKVKRKETELMSTWHSTRLPELRRRIHLNYSQAQTQDDPPPSQETT